MNKKYKNREIDIWMKDRKTAIEFGRKKMEIIILD